MTDYRTEFSCTFDVGAANAAEARRIYNELAERLEQDEGAGIGFGMMDNDQPPTGVVWLYSDGDGDPEHVIAFVKLCAEAFDLRGFWGFVWSLSCSKPKLDAFGGGGQVIDLSRRESLAWLDCAHWLDEQLATAAEQQRGPA